MLAALRAQGIEAQIGTFALPLLGAYRDQGDFPGAEHVFERALALPFHTRLTEAELDRVAEALDKTCESSLTYGAWSSTERKTKEERREEILDAALAEFAERGLHGASTEEIARRAGISQPYVFRLFGTKKELFRAVVARCFRETLEMFQRAAEGMRGEEALDAIGKAYGELLAADRI